MGKKKNRDSFFSSFYGALGNYAGVKVAVIVCGILSGGIAIKSCGNTTVLPSTHGGTTVRIR